MAEELEWESMMMGAEEASIDDEIKGKDEVSLSSRLYKSNEEIEKLIVEESLSEVDRAVWLLRNGTSVQKLSVINSVNRLVVEFNDDFRATILPILLEIVVLEPPVFQRALGKCMVDILTQSLLPAKTVQLIVLLSRKFIDGKDEDAANIWSNVFISCIKYIPIDTITQQILPEALVDGGLAQPAPFRIWCGRVLGAIAMRLDGKRIEELFLKKVLSLCQDTDYDVRTSMCNQLTMIAKALGPKLTKTELIPEYLELVMDEECVVRKAAMDNLMELLEVLDADTKLVSIIPLWRRLCDERPQGIMVSIVKHLGAFLWMTRVDMSESDKKYFLMFYQSLIPLAADNEAIRHMCAYNFPGMITLYKPQYFEALKLDKVLAALASDTSSTVRVTVAQGFHEIVNQLGVSAFKLTKNWLVKLLTTDCIQVVQAILPNLEAILKVYIQDEAARGPNQMDDIFITIMQHEKTHAENHFLTWRTHHDILAIYRIFPDYFDSDLIFETCIPSLFKLLAESSAIPIKHIAIQTLVHFLRKLKRLDHREHILRQLIDLKEDRSCHHRMMFLDTCESILQVFSRKFFRDHMFHHFLGVLRDPVANIRLRFVQLLPIVRATLRTGVDSLILQKLVDATEPLITRDSDSDIMLAMNQLISKYGPLDGNGYTDKTINDSCGMGIRTSSKHTKSTDDDALFGIGSLGIHSDKQTDRSEIGGTKSNSYGTPTLTLKNARTNSNESITDGYLLHSDDMLGMTSEEADKMKEEEETRLSFEQMGTDWTVKRRELHEARLDFHRRFGDKDLGKKSISSAHGSKTKSGFDTNGAGGNLLSSSSGSGLGTSGSGSANANASGKSIGFSVRRRAVGSTAAPPLVRTNVTASSSTHDSLNSPITLGNTPTNSSPSSSKSFLHAAQFSQVYGSTPLPSSISNKGNPSSSIDLACVRKSVGNTTKPSKPTKKSLASSGDHIDDYSPKGSLLLNPSTPRKSFSGELKNLEHELMVAASIPVNLSKVGTSVHSGGVTLPKVQIKVNPASRPISRQTPNERVPELPAASTLKKSYR
ncbi:hypothetical protein BDV3_005775 [Batrachochytrium dendrobatidis]|uniref:Uncharacterized protein n=2 Tax=Batrachochytrium dendrobatidis (strain JEL423) TaxID=403673 RepID=A0A177WMB5_BATDL|nr:hypothetical protein BDEG_24522 [Batrachochytrium dendrobatidis JEL423]